MTFRGVPDTGKHTVSSLHDGVTRYVTRMNYSRAFGYEVRSITVVYGVEVKCLLRLISNSLIAGSRSNAVIRGLGDESSGQNGIIRGVGEIRLSSILS